MNKKGMMPMQLTKCEHCGFYHFFLGNVMLTLTKMELWVMGNIIARHFMDKKEDKTDAFENAGQCRGSDLIN